jgi:hypothetical protein
MSKVSKLAEASMANKIESKASAVGHAHFVLGGKRTITKDEAIKLFGEAADVLDVQFNRMEANLRAVIAAEVHVAEEAKRLISTSKDIAAKVGDAMARVDKVVVKDFEVKLAQLERFVAAMQALDQLKRTGTLDAFVGAMTK